ncbi:MAG: hypothetical protein ABI321_01935 [Polyangia bacterium]
MVLALLLLGCQSTPLTTNDTSHDQGASCAGLDETGCLARTDCVADYCNECSCASTFVGCRAPSATRTACPGLGCAQPGCCTTNEQCSGQTVCFQPGKHGGGQPICDESSVCAADGEVCTQGSCQPPTCGTASQQTTCPANFACTPNGSDASCVRTACTTNADCTSGNFCVDGACYRDLGTCGQAVP